MDGDNVSKLTNNELRQILRSAGWKVSGNKSDLLERIKELRKTEPAVPTTHQVSETDCDDSEKTDTPGATRKVLGDVGNNKVKPERTSKAQPERTTKAQLIQKLQSLGANKLHDLRKPELEQKLHLWEKENLGRKLVKPIPTPSETTLRLPPEVNFKPLTELPKSVVSGVTLNSLGVWFQDRLANTSKDNGRQLFLNKFLKYVRVVHDGDILFVRGTCAAATKRSVEYDVKIVFSFNDWTRISQASCGDECPAGKGWSVACKHVSALAHCIEHFARTGECIENVSCTSQLQEWHRPNAERGRGLKPATINEIIGKPLPPTGKCNEQATNDFLNVLVNCKAQSPSLHSRAANGAGVLNDFGTLTGSPLSLCIMDSVTYVNRVSAGKIEKKTRKQAKCKLWRRVRQPRLTASMAFDVIRTVRTGKLAKGPAKRQIILRRLNVPAVVWGQIHEAVAIKQYEQLVGTKVKSCGIFIDEGCNYFAASPDGWTDDDVLAEVKTLYSGRDGPPEKAECLGSLKKSKMYQLKKNHKYFYQCQLQMHVTGVHRLDFIVWTKKGLYIELIKYDADFCERAFSDMSKYYTEVFAPMYIDVMWRREKIGQ